ncbi:condensation domain-containing protein [Streptomyces stramineus]
MTHPQIEDILPLTPLQEGLLFHTRLDREHRGLYIDQYAVELRGELDAARLKASAAALMARHPALRTGFTHRRTGEPVQAVHRDAPVNWREIDLRPLGSGPAETRVANWRTRTGRSGWTPATRPCCATP